MSDFLDKLSSYNLFNYLLPGTLFAGLGSAYSSYSFIHDNLLIAVFIYYFLGLIISRVGALIIEPALRKLGFLNFTDYRAFVTASRRDKALVTLSETNNMYRTLCSLILLLAGLLALDAVVTIFPILTEMIHYVLFFLLLILFLCSYRKQTDYISRRVRADIDDPC